MADFEVKLKLRLNYADEDKGAEFMQEVITNFLEEKLLPDAREHLFDIEAIALDSIQQQSGELQFDDTDFGRMA